MAVPSVDAFSDCTECAKRRSRPLQNCRKTGAANRTRTCDPVITNLMLYPLKHGAWPVPAGPLRSSGRMAHIQRFKRLASLRCSLYVLSRDSAPSSILPNGCLMPDQIVITEKTSQAKDVRGAVGSRYGEILPAEGHLFDLLEPEDVVPAWKRWSPILLRPEGLYDTCPATGGNKAAKL